MRLLVADHDRGRAKGVAEACTGRGHIVEVAAHGATALELSLERIPEAVICPIDLAVIDGVRLAEILRGNPRTRGTSFIFLVNDELDAPISMDSRDATVVAPWHEADVLDHVDAILERSARFGEGPPYALVAGKPRSDGARPVFHSADPVLVEHMTFRLRAETGFGVRA